jgi:hypothetical protein
MRENSKMHFLIRHFYLRESCVWTYVPYIK